jgi:hypothetical protein
MNVSQKTSLASEKEVRKNLRRRGHSDPFKCRRKSHHARLERTRTHITGTKSNSQHDEVVSGGVTQMYVYLMVYYASRIKRYFLCCNKAKWNNFLSSCQLTHIARVGKRETSSILFFKDLWLETFKVLLVVWKTGTYMYLTTLLDPFSCTLSK